MVTPVSFLTVHLDKSLRKKMELVLSALTTRPQKKYHILFQKEKLHTFLMGQLKTLELIVLGQSVKKDTKLPGKAIVKNVLNIKSRTRMMAIYHA